MVPRPLDRVRASVVGDLEGDFAEFVIRVIAEIAMPMTAVTPTITLDALSPICRSKTAVTIKPTMRIRHSVPTSHAQTRRVPADISHLALLAVVRR
jgi:hypothetical protein